MKREMTWKDSASPKRVSMQGQFPLRSLPLSHDANQQCHQKTKNPSTVEPVTLFP
jgi:hypothetical protein